MTLVRYDYPKVRGWQARGRAGRFSKMFSESRFGDQAREKAQAFADEYNRTHPEEFGPRDIDRSPRANNRSGVPGVSLVTCSPRGPGKHAWTYWQASCPGGPAGDLPQWSKRFTCSVHGFERARELAVEFRTAWVEARDTGTLGDFWADHGHGGQ